MRATTLLVALVAIALGGCAADASDEPSAAEEDEVKVDTRSPAARRQYDANVAFASAYEPTCKKTSERPRVLLTGFGRFMSIGDNATGRIISALVPDAPYPETRPPAPGEVDPPGPQLSVAQATITLPNAGEVDVCAMILPVYWDLAAILIAKEAEAFEPSFVFMNGVAGPRQPLWIELGATNRAAPLDDGSSQLRPAVGPGEPFAKIVERAPTSEDARANLLSWDAVQAAAREALARHADEIDHGRRFGDLTWDAELAGYPRSSNTYLCNNTTYVTGYLMDHPGETVRLLRADPPVPDKPNSVPVALTKDLSEVPRVFMHWPSELAGVHHEAAADVMSAVIDAQLTALANGDAPTAGDNARAAPDLRGGDFF